MRVISALVSLSVLCGFLLPEVKGHGRLLSPPGRPTMWRFDFKNAINYDDNQLFCGGFDRQWYKNGGKCGICGDPWDEPAPRENEDGGRFGRGIVVKRYKEGQETYLNVEITAHHMGYFEFRLCPITHKDQVADQECLDKYLLEQANGDGPRYYLPPVNKMGLYPVKVRLPPGLTCDRCVLQWHYHTGNRWGPCPDGVGRMGCGEQETFRGCADVAIDPVDTRGNVSESSETAEKPTQPRNPKKRDQEPAELDPKPVRPSIQANEIVKEPAGTNQLSPECKLPTVLKKIMPKK